MCNPQSALPDGGGSVKDKPGSRRRHSLPLLARHMIRTMPWVTLISGCLAGLGFLAIMADLADTYHHPLDQGTVRLAFLPAIAALAFVLRTPFRPLTQTTPVPAWVTPAGHLLLATPVLAATSWAQLGIMNHTSLPHIFGRPPAVYPLIAQLVGWCAVMVVAAACVDRTRYADLGGAIAAPVTFVAILVAWYLPATARILVQPFATAHGATIAWYVVASAALVLTCAALRDRWHRYSWLRAVVRRGPSSSLMTPS